MQPPQRLRGHHRHAGLVALKALIATALEGATVTTRKALTRLAVVNLRSTR
jgi:hypothetical protein